MHEKETPVLQKVMIDFIAFCIFKLYFKIMKIKLQVIIAFFVAMTTYSQQKFSTDSIVRSVTIESKLSGNTLEFSPIAPPLNQIAGAPKAFYTYFWEFGDGHYSTDSLPKHTYRNIGEYNVKLWATNNYDTGKPPTTRPKKVTVMSEENDYNDTSSMYEDFTLKRNREPIPNEEIVVVMSYKNPKDFVANGKIYLFYNEQKYKDNNFNIKDTRMYHNEQIIEDEESFVYANDLDDNQMLMATSNGGMVTYNSQELDTINKTNLPLTLEDSKVYYKNWNILEFNDIQPNEERNVFLTMETPQEMLKDTSAIISIRGVYVPDRNYDNHQVKDMEMEIVTSHDPNKMASNGTFMNYRLVRFKRLKYKIRFQNNGEGPARTIRLETDLPDMFDKSTLKVEDMYPKCEICPKQKVAYSCLDTIFTDSQVIFTFKNIYLPGSEQKGVMDKDSTKGFVKYSIKFGKDFHKKNTKSQTAIVFDKNDPIMTNYSTTRFIPGISIGAKVGYNYYPELEASTSYFIGATISPYKSYRWYWQVEWLNSFNSYTSKVTIFEEFTGGARGFRQLQRRTTSNSYESINWEVPVLVRYNINNYIGVGAGIQANINISEKQNESILIEDFEGDRADFLIDSRMQVNETTESFTNFKAGLLFEITGGFARIGPSVGARYVLNSENERNYWQLYAIWKF